MNRKGEAGMSIITMYRVMLVVIVAIVILGASAIFYSYDINIRDTEAMLMLREIAECVASDAVVDLTSLRTEDDVFEYCGFEEEEVETFFVSVVVSVEGKEGFRIEGGDSGLLWVRDIYSPESSASAAEKYEPGNFEEDFNVFVLDGGVEQEGVLRVEVVANVE